VRRSVLLLFGVATLIVILDQWTKRWAMEHLAGRDPVPVIGEIVRFTFTRNSGVAFGLGSGLPFPYAVFSILAAIVILYLFFRHPAHSLPRQLALALILGGALGNLVDRVTSGQVVDFILVGWRRWYWPVFNLADSAVSAGVVLFALTWAGHTERLEPAETSPPAPAPGSSGDPHAPAVGPGVEERGAAGPLPRAGADGPVA
jgi:signal peptidase II